ncbi:MAG: MerR family transcriptional regulator [Bryobacterales bacterium]|nr:MerR family transcriptional regulator [Bryobacterales bacterium]
MQTDLSRYVTMKTILQRTGVHRQTVHYYLRKELLPRPVRTSRTSALYQNTTIDLIQMIQLLKRQQRLSLEEITALFRRHNYDVRAIRAAASQSGSASAGALLGDPASAPIAIGDIAERIDPPPPREWIEQALASGMVHSAIRDGRKTISAGSLEALDAMWEGVRSGASLDQFRDLARRMERQTQAEFDHFLASLRNLNAASEASTQVARLFSSLERFGACRRREALYSLFMQRLRLPGYLFLSPNRTYVFPSRTFLQRMGLFRELDLILRQLDRKPDDLAALRNLARASYLSSDWVRSRSAAVEILRLAPNDASAEALYGQALTFLGRMPEAITFLEEAIARGPNPMAKVRLGQAMALHAYDTGDASLLLDAVVRRTRLANEAIRESAGNPGLHRKVRLNIVLDTLHFSDPLGLNRPVEKEAQALYDEFRSLPDKKLPVFAGISLAMSKMYITYALYLIRQQQGNPKAEKLLAEIARLDPDCVLAGRGNGQAASIKAKAARRASRRTSPRKPAGGVRGARRG